MPSGPKKRKAAKRKNQKMPVDIHQDDSPTDPNPNSGFLPPLIPRQGNGRDRGLALMEDEGEEAFETPRFQPETPRLPETLYYSIENARSGRRDFIDVLSEVALIGEKLKGLGLEIPSEEEERWKEMKLEESAVVAENYNGLLHQEIASEEGEEGRKDDDVLKGVKLDESVHVTEVESSKREEEAVEKLDKYDSIEAVNVSSSNEKEVKVVPLSDEGIHTDNREVNVDDYGDIHFESEGFIDFRRNVERELKDDIHFESEGFIDFRRNVERELKRNQLMLADNGGLIADVDGARSDDEGYINFRGSIEKELYLNNGGVECADVDSIHENFTGGVESVPEKLPQIDVDLANNKLEKSVENGFVSVENTALNTKVQSIGNKAYQENAAEPSSHVEEAEDAHKKEAAGGPVVAHHATFWNCCGLFEVFTRSDR